MRKVHIIRGLLAILWLAVSGVSFAEVGPPVTMEVSAHHPAPGKYVLHVKVTNMQTIPVSILNVDLPWYTPNEFVLIPRGIRLDQEKGLMARGGPTSDYMYVTHTLAPGEFLEGDVTLHNMFSTLLKDIDEFGVIVVWSCKAKRLNLTCKEGSGGSFLIPKGGGTPQTVSTDTHR